MEACMSRVAIPLHCESDVLLELERLSRSRAGDARLVERARIILACLSGKRDDEVAAECGTYPTAVGIWRKRFAAQGIGGLYDKTRSGKPPGYAVAGQRQPIMDKPEEAPPKGLGIGDSGFMAKELAVSDDAVWRILRKEGIQLRLRRFWSVGADPEFAAKSADIIGLYPGPSAKSIGALCR